MVKGKSPKKVVTVEEIQKLDALVIKDIGIPSVVLMENAGRVVAEEVVKVLKSKKLSRVTIVCGTGNNAGDGFVATRHLMERGVKVRVLVVGKARDFKNDPACFYRVIRKLKASVYFWKDVRKEKEFLRSTDVIVDALFGVGLNRAVTDPYKAVIEAVNRSKKYVIAVDIPSGLNGTTGAIWGCCVRAKITVSFSCAKKGFYLKEGPVHAGNIRVRSIGIPMALLKK